MQYCVECVTPETRPRITFDAAGICSACTYAAGVKRRTDWGAKRVELEGLVDRYRSSGGYDCIVPASGGKDSHFQAWFAKEELGLNPLVVTFVPAVPTVLGVANRRNLIERLGVDHIAITPNPHAHRTLSRAMFEAHGNPFLPWIQGIFSAVAQVAVEKGVSLILYGENGEAEYGGDTTSAAAKSLDEGGIELRMRSGRHNWRDPSNWDQYGVEKRQLLPYIVPGADASSGLKRVFLGDYVPWNNNHNLYTAMNTIGGFRVLDRRTVGTYTHGASIDDDIDELYLWLLWVKFGFGRASKSASPDVREGKLRREGAVELVRRYDGEYPWYLHDSWLNYLGMSEDGFWAVVSRFVGDEANIGRERAEAAALGEPFPERIPAWERVADGQWRHVGTVHGEERMLRVPLRRPSDLGPYP